MCCLVVLIYFNYTWSTFWAQTLTSSAQIRRRLLQKPWTTANLGGRCESLSSESAHVRDLLLDPDQGDKYREFKQNGVFGSNPFQLVPVSWDPDWETVQMWCFIALALSICIHTVFCSPFTANEDNLKSSQCKEPNYQRISRIISLFTCTYWFTLRSMVGVNCDNCFVSLVAVNGEVTSSICMSGTGTWFICESCWAIPCVVSGWSSDLAVVCSDCWCTEFELNRRSSGHQVGHHMVHSPFLQMFSRGHALCMLISDEGVVGR